MYFFREKLLPLILAVAISSFFGYLIDVNTVRYGKPMPVFTHKKYYEPR